MTVIRKLQNPENDKSLIGLIINDIKKKLDNLGALSCITYHVEQMKWHTQWLHRGEDVTP